MALGLYSCQHPALTAEVTQSSSPQTQAPLMVPVNTKRFTQNGSFIWWERKVQAEAGAGIADSNLGGLDRVLSWCPLLWKEQSSC